MSDAGAARRAGRRNALVIAAIFFAPLAAAVWLYFSSGWRPAPGAVHGELIDPAQPLPEFAFTLPDGSRSSARVLRGSWFVVLFEDADCDARCAADLEALGRLRLALAKNAWRVRRVLLHAGGCCSQAAAGPDLLVLGAAGEAGSRFRALFPRDTGVYVVDPYGNLLMRYPDTADARGMLKDLERLLRLSRIG